MNCYLVIVDVKEFWFMIKEKHDLLNKWDWVSNEDSFTWRIILYQFRCIWRISLFLAFSPHTINNETSGVVTLGEIDDLALTQFYKPLKKSLQDHTLVFTKDLRWGSKYSKISVGSPWELDKTSKLLMLAKSFWWKINPFWVGWL